MIRCKLQQLVLFEDARGQSLLFSGMNLSASIIFAASPTNSWTPSINTCNRAPLLLRAPPSNCVWPMNVSEKHWTSA